MKESLKIFAGDLKNSFKDLLPIIIVVALFQGLINEAPRPKGCEVSS